MVGQVLKLVRVSRWAVWFPPFRGLQILGQVKTELDLGELSFGK
jgi:hypothetical protein